MLEAYLAFARGDSGEHAQPTDMAMALEELRSDAERNGHTATVTFHGLPVVTVKPASFKRCLANLVSNAARHANTVAITGHRDHRYLTVTIDDDGPGIPADMREEVFKPFLRLDDARNQDEGGTGLGLAIARDIARSHGGDITLGDSPMGGPACGGADPGLGSNPHAWSCASVARSKSSQADAGALAPVIGRIYRVKPFGERCRFGIAGCSDRSRYQRVKASSGNGQQDDGQNQGSHIFLPPLGVNESPRWGGFVSGPLHPAGKRFRSR